jgi:hypothetical protein
VPLPGQPVSALPVADEPRQVHVLRIGETLQSDESLMAQLRRVGALPGQSVQVVRDAEGVRIGEGSAIVALAPAQAVQVIVAA